MKTLGLLGRLDVVRRVQKDIRRAPLLNPHSDLFHPLHQKLIVGLQIRTANETNLGKQRQRSRTRRHFGLFRLSVQDRRITRDAAEQCPGIKTDALDASVQQQAIEHALFVTFHEKRHVAHLYGERHVEFVKKAGQLGQTLRCEAGRQLQPERRDPSAQRREQADEFLSGAYLLTKVAVVADVFMEFGGEAEIVRHCFCPALHRGGGGTGIERGVAFNSIEYLRVETQEIIGAGIFGVQRIAPGVFTP